MKNCIICMFANDMLYIRGNISDIDSEIKNNISTSEKIFIHCFLLFCIIHLYIYLKGFVSCY